MCGAIPINAFRLMGYCLTLMGVAELVSCTMMGGRCLASPGGLFSAQTSGISVKKSFKRSFLADCFHIHQCLLRGSWLSIPQVYLLVIIDIPLPVGS